MLELLAGALLAAAVLAVVLQPLFHPHQDDPGDDSVPDPEALARAERLVREIAQHAPAPCAGCGYRPDAPAAYCPRCGQALADDPVR